MCRIEISSATFFCIKAVTVEVRQIVQNASPLDIDNCYCFTGKRKTT